MNKIEALVEAANRLKHNMIGPVSMVVSADTILELCARVEQVEKRPPQELLWLYTHCCAIGMKRRSDSGKLEHDIALFTADLCTLLQQAEEALKAQVEDKRDGPFFHEDEHPKGSCLRNSDEALAAIKQFKERT